MTQEPPKSNVVLIVIAVIGVIGTIVASAIGAIANYNIEKFRQEAELTKIALVSIATQGGATQKSLANTLSAPTSTLYPTYTPVPFPTIPPTPTISLPFTDNFDLGARSEWGEERGTWITNNGKYTISDIGNDWTSGISTIGDLAWANYIVKITVNLQQASFCGNNRVAILVRVQNTKNFLAFKIHDGGECISTIPINYATWYVVRDGEWVEISNTRYEDYPHREPFTLMVQVNGDLITTFFNNEQASSFSALPFSNGKVGVFLESHKGDNGLVQTATLDDFSIEEIPAP